ncbi:helix-turn-helix transcriptional regulator [Formivibrio citricus]|nr:AraC family transcriptional regulator [Formivibrio citricus]
MNKLESPHDFSRLWSPLASMAELELDSTPLFPAFSGESDYLGLRQGAGIFRVRWEGGGGMLHLMLAPALRFFFKLDGRYGLSVSGDTFRTGGSSPALVCGPYVPEMHSVRLSLSASPPGQVNELLVFVLPWAWLGERGLPAEKWPAGLLTEALDPVLQGKVRGLAAWMDRPEVAAEVLSLRVEALLLSIVADLIEQRGATDSVAVMPAEQSRLQMLKDFLDSGDADDMQLADIARHAGSNVSTLQSRFRRVFGKTICEYLRESRLRRVAERIEREGISIGLAAELAGYSSQGNFSTAFRRCFGVSPGQVKAGVARVGEAWP